MVRYAAYAGWAASGLATAQTFPSLPLARCISIMIVQTSSSALMVLYNAMYQSGVVYEAQEDTPGIKPE